MFRPYRYLKVPPRKKRVIANWMISLILISSGSLIVFWVIWPIISFSISDTDLFAGITSPVSDGSAGGAKPSFLSPVALAAAPQNPTDNGQDLTDANAWFPTVPQKKVITPVNTYRISIPRLKISEALVTIAGDDLNHSLVHYGGTGLPGDYGTTVIFGHSTLPQFYSPTNYYSIFSLLPTLKPGDDIYVNYDSVHYTYKVEELLVTDPTDLTPLTQQFDDSYLTLVTCVPPGTTWKRLNVRAKLVRV